MRYVACFVAISCCFAVQAGSTSASLVASSAGQAVRACAVLTRDLVAPFTENKTMLDLIPPEEEALDAPATACEYGAVRLQLFPGRGGKRTMSGSDLEPVTGAGEGGYYRNNRNRYAELMIWTGKHALDLQVSIPSGRTAEAIKPQVIALANAIIAKLP